MIPWYLAALGALLALGLGGCNRNSAPGNDREAQIDAAPAPSPIEDAGSAIANVDKALLKPETMSQADLAALGGLAGKCAVRLTEVALPSLVFTPETAVIKLNGKLIPLRAVRTDHYRGDGTSLTLRPNEDRGDAGLEGIDMILVPPGARDEVGYAGFRDCGTGRES